MGLSGSKEFCLLCALLKDHLFGLLIIFHKGFQAAQDSKKVEELLQGFNNQSNRQVVYSNRRTILGILLSRCPKN
jgi:hypothetical protein